MYVFIYIYIIVFATSAAIKANSGSISSLKGSSQHIVDNTQLSRNVMCCFLFCFKQEIRE